MSTFKLHRTAVHPEHHVSQRVGNVISAYYGRDVELDYEFAFDVVFSTRRRIAVYITECDELGHQRCVSALVHIYDPSMTANYSEHCWQGFADISPESFSVAQFVSTLGLASLNGGLASIEVKIHFAEGQTHKVPHLIMQIAGLVDMYTR